MSAPTYISGGYSHQTATAQIATFGRTVLGIFVASATTATLQVYDSATATTTTPVTGAVTVSGGVFYPLYAACGTGIYVVATGTVDYTVVFA